MSDEFSLKQTNVSQPRLLHSHSKQSVTASEDYYSLSDRDYASSAGGDDAEHLHPPSRFHTPEDDPQSEAALQSARPVRHSPLAPQGTHIRRKPLGSPPPKELATVVEQKSLAADKRGATEEKKDSKMDPIARTYTPGMDDSAYIRFAIDQLTRDEEVRGSRTYPVKDEEDSGTPATEESAPLQPRRESSPTYSPEDIRLGRRPPQDIRLVPPTPPEQMPTRRAEEDAISAAPPASSLRMQENMARQKEMQAGPAPQHPLEGTKTDSSNSVPENDVFIAYDPIHPSTQQPRLNFLPGILRPLWLGLFVLLCVLMLTGLLFCAIFGLTHDGLWEYKDFGDSRYFVFQYLPTIFGMIILIWLIQIQVAVQRIAPFMAISSSSTKSASEAQFLNLYPTQFLMPKFRYFRAGQPILGLCFFIFWLFLFTIPLLSSSFNVGFFGPTDDGVWRWVAVQGVIWTVIALYILLIITLILLGFELSGTRTGLKWDPRSLADLIVLLERANFMSEYAGTEVYHHVGDFRQRLWNTTPRLGYWFTSRRPNDVFYGLGEEGGLTRRYSIEQGRIREKVPIHSHRPSIASHEDIEIGDESRAQMNYRHNSVQRSYLPWFLSSSSLLAWILAAFVLLIAFYVVTFVNQATTDKGFLPQISADTNSSGFSPANFLYSFIPGLLGLLLFLLWLPLDFTHRRLEPFRVMTSSSGATAEHSILLDYPFRLPGSITVAALVNSHWKVAFLSLISLINTAIPILSGGIFWAQWYTGSTDVRISAHPAGLYAVCFFLALYAVSLFALIPGRKHMRLPHEAKCLAELISWMYQSPLLVDRAFSRCVTKAELQTRLLGERAAAGRRDGFWASVTNLVHSLSAEGLRQRGDGGDEPRTHKAKAVLGTGGGLAPPSATRDEERGSEKTRSGLEQPVRYGFGVFTGRDGRDHIEIDKI